MKLIYLLLLIALYHANAQFSEQQNWTFADLPSTTNSEKRFKCSRKLDFSCECRAASTMYDVGLVETEHPFCLTAAGQTHGACTGGCIDSKMQNYINQNVNGVSITVKAECDALTRTWTDPILPKCLNEKGEDMYHLGGGGECDSLTKCTGNSICKFGGTCQTCTTTPTFANTHLGQVLPDAGIAGKCEMPGAAADSVVDVTATFATKAECESAFTYVAPIRNVKKYYETSTFDEASSTFTTNDHRQCVAGVKTASRLGDDECPRNDPFCNQFPRIEQIDIDSDNYNTMTLSASFTRIGTLQRCSSTGRLDATSEKYDKTLHPLAPCPDVDEPYYCDYPQNELFGTKLNDTNKTLLDTTCGVGIYDNKTRNGIGLPHGIREYENGYDNEAFQWSVETEDPVSLASNINEILSEFETVQMNIFSVGKIIDSKFVLSSNREGLDENSVNNENVMELIKFFDRLALSGDAVDFSDLKNKSEIHKVAEWTPIDLDADGKVSQFRCHSMPDNTISSFRQINDIRTDFIDKFFAANKEQDCVYGAPALDNETRSFKRCANNNESTFLYPSTRKAFFNQIKSDGFFAGMMKGQRFIKEMAQSEEEIGFIDGGSRQLPDGTDVDQNATYNHIKFMMSMTTEQLENCNTVTGHCRPTWHEYPTYRFNVEAAAKLVELKGVNASSFTACKMACYNHADCGGFMYKANAGLQECNLIAATGNTFSGAAYTALKDTLLQDNQADDYTSVTLDRPNCLFTLLNTRYVNIEESASAPGVFRDVQPHTDDITGFWGVGETVDKGSQHAYQTCRTSITIQKSGKIDADQVDLGLRNTAGEEFIPDYPYTITINDEDCVNQVVEKEEAVSQATSAAVSLTEAEEMVKIAASGSPAFCRSDSGTYTGTSVDSTDGGVCLSHKQKERYQFAGNPFGNTVEKAAKCMDGAVDKINLYPHKKDCVGAGFAWSDARSFIHEGRAETCFVNGVYSLHLYPNKTACKAETGGVWTDAVPATHAFGFISDDDYRLLSPSCVDGNGNSLKQHITVTACQANGGTWTTVHTSDTVPISYEDERLTCGHMDYPQAKHANGPYNSKYDRVRMALYVDVLRLKDLYNEGKGASTIVPRGFPVGLTEGHTPVGGCKDCVLREVGQHRLTLEDQDVVYYNPETEQECTLVEASDATSGCLTYSYATDYRASGMGETYRGETQQQRDDRNQIRQVIGEYIVRDVGIDEANTNLGSPFWKDELITISYLGTSTSSDEPLQQSVQDIRENYGDGKIYSRYLIELFSDCLDRTQQQQHSSRLHFQTFKDGRLHGDRIKDSLSEIKHGDYNAGFATYNLNSSAANGEIIIEKGNGVLNTFRPGDLVTLSGCTTASDNGDYALSAAAYVEQTSSVTTKTVSKIDGQHACDVDASSTTVTGVTEEDRQQACAAAADAVTKSAFALARADDGAGNYDCTICDTGGGQAANPNTADFYTFFKTTSITALGIYDYKATVTDMPATPHVAGTAITRTLDATCKIAQRERSCDGFSFDAKTTDLLADASTVHDSFALTTKDVCGPVELDQTGCGADASLWADLGSCSSGAFTNRHDCVTNSETWTQTCKYLRPCGSDIPSGFGYDSTCTTPSENRCQICNYDTPTCYDSTIGPLTDGKLAARAKMVDMQCAGFDFTNPNIKLGMTVKKIIPSLGEEITNLDFYDLPVEVQRYGNIYGAELVEYSIGFNLIDTIDFEPDQYLTLEGMGSRTEVIAWLKNNRIGEIESVRDVRDMGDLTYPQLTTEEVIFTVQSYDPNFDPELHNVHIETLSICSHSPLTYFEPYIQLGKIHRNVVNCLVGKVNDGKDGYGNVLSPTTYPEVQAGTDACQYVYEQCPHKPNTGFSLKREEDNYFLLASYRPLYGQEGHLFIDDTCDILSITRLVDLLTLPDFGNVADNNIVYAYANNLPEDSNGVASGNQAVLNACVKSGAPAPEDFFKKLGPQNQQIPVSQTIVRNFKSMMMKEAKDLNRGVREVVPCRRLATHGDDLSPEFADTILYGYDTAFGSQSKLGDRFEPRNCWFDSYFTTCADPNGTDVTATYDTVTKCTMPAAMDPISAVSEKPRQCTAYQVGFGTGTPSTVLSTFNRFANTDNLNWTVAECHQLCEDNSQASYCEFRKQSETCSDTTHTTKVACEENGEEWIQKGQCLELTGNNAGITADTEGQYLVTECADRTDTVAPSGTGFFSANTKAIASNASTLSEAQIDCVANAACAGINEILAAPAGTKCDNGAPFDAELVLVDVAQMASRGSLLKHNLEECMYQCAGVANMTHVEFVAGQTCTCKQMATARTCNAQQASAIADTYAIDVDVTTKIISGRSKAYELFEVIDDKNIDATSVKGLNSKYYTKVTGCSWCTWDNTQPKTHSDDTESCMTNVLSHINGPDAFEQYLDGIGSALDMDKEICVQKNNMYRTTGSKHISCPYNNLYNFDMDSVYAPEQFSITDEEKSYRLNPSSPAWDALIFHPDDVGDIANHWEPITNNFILPIKAEIIIQGHSCLDDYDLAAADGAQLRRRRRRLLGNKIRKRVGQPRRKLLQSDSSAGQFGATANIAFKIAISPQAATQASYDGGVIINGNLLRPGDVGYPFDTDADGKLSQAEKEKLVEAINAQIEEEKECQDTRITVMWILYGVYYLVILGLSLALPRGAKINIF